MIFHDIQQNTEQWYDLRAGKDTSSVMACIMAHFGKSFGDPAKQLAQKIALERFTGNRVSGDHYMSAAMRRGHELEPAARMMYEKEEFCTVTNGGFIESDDHKRGDSPDGLVGKDGGVEIKSVEYAAHWKVKNDEAFPSQYKWQIHFHIWMCERQWFDFVSYCPEFPDGQQLYVFRVERDEQIIMKMKIRLAQFEELVEENLKLLTK